MARLRCLTSPKKVTAPAPMMLKRWSILALILTLLVSAASPIGAQTLSDARAKRESARSQRAKTAAELKLLQATDKQVESALADLDANFRTVQAKANAASQAARAAAAELVATRAELDETRAEIGRLHDLVVDRAVAAYVRPRTQLLDEVISAESVGEVGRRQVLLEQVAANDVNVIDRLRAAREDLEFLEEQNAAAAEKAAARQAEAAAVAAEARKARDEKARVAKELDARIAEYRNKIDALARQDAHLTALIRQQEAASVFPGGPSSSGLIWPVRGRVTSEFGYRWGRQHQGIDVGAPAGTSIWAANAGVVIFSGVMSGYGNVIVLDHGGGFTTVYAHQSRLGASQGERVSRGQVIGYVGSTGRSTGNHLHFETRVNGTPRNPRAYLG